MDHDDITLQRLIGGIASDTKHILARQDLQDTRINKHGDRITALERTQGRSAGRVATIAFFIPLVLVVVGWFVTN